MNGILLETSRDVSEALRIPASEFQPRLCRELAIRLYQRGLLPFGKARELAGMTKWDFHSVLGEEGIDRSYDKAELQEDIVTLSKH